MNAWLKQHLQQGRGGSLYISGLPGTGKHGDPSTLYITEYALPLCW